MNCPNCNKLMDNIGTGQFECWSCGERIGTLMVTGDTKQYHFEYAFDGSIDVTSSEGEHEALVTMLTHAINDGYTGEYVILPRRSEYNFTIDKMFIRHSIVINKQVDRTIR